jgi:hypothetical protein
MHHASWIALVATLCSSLLVSLQAETPKEYKDQEEVVVKMFKAYNNDDAKGVFEDYVQALKSAGAEALWNALYAPNKKKYGKYVKHTFVKEGSATTDGITLLRMDVEFENDKKVHVVINFGQEEKKWKIQQVTFAAPKN